MRDLIIVGAGGLGLEVAAYARDLGHSVRGFLDDKKSLGESHGVDTILGATDSPLDTAVNYIIAVGSVEGRLALANKLTAKGATFATLIHPLSYCAAGASVGGGSIIAPFAFVGPAACVGLHCLINTHATVGHESRLGDLCVLSPYAGVLGQASLEHNVFLGSNAVVTARIRVGHSTRIAAGSVVYDNIAPERRVFGNPAKSATLEE